MNELCIRKNGTFTFSKNGRDFIFNSPLGIVIENGCAYSPKAAEQDEKNIILHYPCGDVGVSVKECGSYHKLTVDYISDNIKTFIFGPYKTHGTALGDIIGASWNDDGSVVCIQSLMPKVEGGIKYTPEHNTSGVPLFKCKPAHNENGLITLQCSTTDHSHHEVTKVEGILSGDGRADMTVKPIPGCDGFIQGAAIALIAANNACELLDIISEMEICEGLPHPTINGKYTKKDKLASALYLIMPGSDISTEEKIKIAERANASGIYLSDLLKTWGHFETNDCSYPNGRAGIKELTKKASASGINIGTHTLSNFITTDDKFVSPIPHKKLLFMDITALSCEIDAKATDIIVDNENNYTKDSILNAIRIDDEIITFKYFDADNMCLRECTRGAFGTKASPHSIRAGVYRLMDHPYRIFFPDIELQDEMADNITTLINETGITRLSFDGLEGCMYTGAGEYACAEFVRRIFEGVGNHLICDASIATNYVWHALSYGNWGEPWYDSQRRGGLNQTRARNIAYANKNLLPNMLGWYAIYDQTSKYEATLPENMEFILSRMVAFNAGCAIQLKTDVFKKHGRIDEYLEMIRLWQEFKDKAYIPDEIRMLMQDENSNWHLERTDTGYKLTSLIIREQELGYCQREMSTETGVASFFNNKSENSRLCTTRHILDASADEKDEVLNFRIRVGIPGKGLMKGLQMNFNSFANIGSKFQPCSTKFDIDAIGGDYIEFSGGNRLCHYDCNFNIKNIYTNDTLNSLKLNGLSYLQFTYLTDDDNTDYIFKEFRRKKEYLIDLK